VNLVMHIGSDPASWIVPDRDYEGLAAQLREATAPVVVQVVDPLAGQLVLSPRAAGSVVILQPPPGGDWNPSDWNPSRGPRPSAPIVYLASPSGPGTGSRYAVSADVDADTVVHNIKTAMSGEATRTLTLPVYGPAGTGLMVIDGATLPFAVVC
jgi:hypothetical protein